MFIENDIVYWETDSSHVEVYDVRLIATDGFQRTAQEFQLFSRAGVKILSSAPKKRASVGKNTHIRSKYGNKKLIKKLITSCLPDLMEWYYILMEQYHGLLTLCR